MTACEIASWTKTTARYAIASRSTIPTAIACRAPAGARYGEGRYSTSPPRLKSEPELESASGKIYDGDGTSFAMLPNRRDLDDRSGA